MPPMRPHRPALQVSKKGLDDRGLQLNPTKCDNNPARSLSLDIHPPEAPGGWKVRQNNCFALLGAAFGPPDFRLRKLQQVLDRAEKLMTQLVRLQSPATAAVLAFASAGARSAAMPARCPRTASSSAPRKMRTFAHRLPSSKVDSATETPFSTHQASFPPSSSSTTSICGSPWADHNDTHDPNVAAAETQFRRNIREDAAWRPDGATHTQSYLSNLCGAHTLDTLMERACCWDADLTRAALQHRLRIPFLDQDTAPRVLGRFCDNAAACACAGDRNLRHTAVAHVCCDAAQEAGLRPPKEKRGSSNPAWSLMASHIGTVLTDLPTSGSPTRRR